MGTEGLLDWDHLCQSAGMLQVSMWEQRGCQSGIICGNLQGNFTHTRTRTHMHAHPSPWSEVAELSSFYEMKHHSPSFYTLSMGVKISVVFLLVMSPPYFPRCDCAPNWFGILCTSSVNDCSGATHQALCGHGTCVNAPNTHAGRVRLHPNSYIYICLISFCVHFCMKTSFGTSLEQPYS